MGCILAPFLLTACCLVASIEDSGKQFRNGVQSYAMGYPHAASYFFDRSHSGNPEDAECIYYLALCSIELKKLDAARAWCETALAGRTLSTDQRTKFEDLLRQIRDKMAVEKAETVKYRIEKTYSCTSGDSWRYNGARIPEGCLFSGPNLLPYYSDCPAAAKMYMKSKTWYTLAGVFLIPTTIGAVIEVTLNLTGDEIDLPSAVVFGSTALLYLIFNAAAEGIVKQSVDIYNSRCVPSQVSPQGSTMSESPFSDTRSVALKHTWTF